MRIYPLKFEPIFKERIWGSRNLETIFGKKLPAGKKIGESWELADLPGDKSTVANGPYAGLTLERVIALEGERLTGKRELPSPFPLFIKILDCAEALSIQVHPDAAACRRLGRGAQKIECWYILRAEEGAVIYMGLRPGVTRLEFEEAVSSGRVEESLRRVPVRPGECYFVPAGTPHALGAGLLIAEIQTPSDTTYRIFDWNRRDELGQPRPLHVPEALASIHFSAAGDDLSVQTGRPLVSCPYFRVEKLTTAPGRQVDIEPGRLQIFIILSGYGEIAAQDVSVPCQPGDTLLIPASLQARLTGADPIEYLSITP